MVIWKSDQWWRDNFGFNTATALTRWDRRLAAAVAFAAVVLTGATLIGAVVMIIRLYSEGEPEAVGNPLETIFQSRLMIGAARLVILFVGLYIVLSVLRHIRRGQWLTGAGPFKIQESMKTVSDEASELGEDLRRALRENERLRSSLATSTQQIRTLETLLQKAQDELRKSPPSGGDAKGVG